MRIAYLVSQYPAVNHTFILREIQRLRLSGFDVRVISIRPPDRQLSRLSPDELAELSQTRTVLLASRLVILRTVCAALLTRPAGFVRGLKLVLQLGGLSVPRTIALFKYLAEALVAGHWIVEDGCDRFHVHFSSTVGLLITAVFPLRMSVTIHGPDEFADPVGFHLARKVEASTFVSVISHFGRSQVMRFSHPSQWPKIEVVRLGVDPMVYSPRPHRSAPERFELLFVGRLAPVKAPAVLLNATHLVVKRGHNLHLRFVGDGPERSALQAQVTNLGLVNRVTFEGWKNQDEVRHFYDLADVFVLPSFAEGVPVVLMEAMAKEIACVATWVAGIPELITHGVDGLLAPPSDEQGLADAICQLLEDAGLRRQLGEAARIRVLKDYNLGTNINRMIDIMRAHAC